MSGHKKADIPAIFYFYPLAPNVEYNKSKVHGLNYVCFLTPDSATSHMGFGDRKMIESWTNKQQLLVL